MHNYNKIKELKEKMNLKEDEVVNLYKFFLDGNKYWPAYEDFEIWLELYHKWEISLARDWSRYIEPNDK